MDPIEAVKVPKKGAKSKAEVAAQAELRPPPPPVDDPPPPPPRPTLRVLEEHTLSLHGIMITLPKGKLLRPMHYSEAQIRAIQQSGTRLEEVKEAT